MEKKLLEFSSDCDECAELEKDLEPLFLLLGEDGNPLKKNKKEFNKRLRKILKHLNTKHKIFEEGQLVGFGIALGPAIGVGLGSAMGSVGSGIGIGVAVGLVFGSILEKKAKDEDRIV